MGHIEKETCIIFRNVGEEMNEDDDESQKETEINDEENKKEDNILKPSNITKLNLKKEHDPYLKLVNKTVETDDDAIDSNALRSKKLNLGKLHLRSSGK